MSGIKKHRIIIPVWIFCLLQVYIACHLHAQENNAAKEVVGWVEYAYIAETRIEIMAKLDSGADNSSLNAGALFTFKRNGSDFVRFDIVNHKGQKRSLEAKIIRIAPIKRHQSMPDHRPVILLDICLGKTCKKAEVNLADRSKFTYQLLLGRSFLKDDFLIDPSRQFVLRPH